jgi:hypothetical protein
MCAEACSNFTLFGCEWGRECWCGQEIARTALGAPEQDCNLPCGGDNSTMCGGDERISLFKATAVEMPQYGVTEPEGFEYVGCFTDDVANRSLDGPALFDAANMTVDLCAQHCVKGGYPWMGLEHGGECYCSDKLQESSNQRAEYECAMFCTGDPGRFQICGSPNRLSVYRALEINDKAHNQESQVQSSSHMPIGEQIPVDGQTPLGIQMPEDDQKQVDDRASRDKPTWMADWQS